ncbi:hypothetical protein BS78_10G116300 [Paspalum vaginatum]|nr:hypothetical protein BS78_10G116300 [Paspalum vaginatum]
MTTSRRSLLPILVLAVVAAVGDDAPFVAAYKKATGVERLAVTLDLYNPGATLLERVHHLWNEWEIQCLVLVSFCLQVFLHLFASTRKRKMSRLLSLLLWLAYLLADYIATFTLGRLTLHIDEPRHQLVLFWTPFLLLHLGGQETMAAFSMEDAALWKRHLLGLVSQVVLAVYIAVKSWRPGPDMKLILGPFVLMFISGTIKYAERTWALMTANSIMAPGSSSMADHMLRVQDDVIVDAKSYFSELENVLSHEQQLQQQGGRIGEVAYQGLVKAAGKGLRMCLDFLTDMTPFVVWPERDDDNTIKRAMHRLEASDPEGRVKIAYKLVEIQLSLAYDYLYTKYGAFQFRLTLVSSGIERLVAFVSTAAALALFMGSTLGVGGGAAAGRQYYTRTDMVVSYVLLTGALALDISSMFMLLSSYWSQLRPQGRWTGAIFRLLVRRVHPDSKPLWSEKMAQYNLVDACIREEQATGLWGWIVRKTGIGSGAVTHTPVSTELKRLVLEKLLHVATTRSVNDYWGWDFSKYHAQWLQWELEGAAVGLGQDEEEGGFIARGILSDGITDAALYFPMTVLVWHIATEMCFFDANDSQAQSQSQCPHPRTAQISVDLSRYVMYLVAKRNVMSGSNGHFELGKARRTVRRVLRGPHARPDLDERGLLKFVFDPASQVTEPCFARARAIAGYLLRITTPFRRWELISTLWLEMLCYLAPNCGAPFHAKHLSTGGEFVTHVRILIIMLGIPFLKPDYSVKF